MDDLLAFNPQKETPGIILPGEPINVPSFAKISPENEGDPESPNGGQPKPSDGETPWMVVAKSQLGVKEIPGRKHNPQILKYFTYTSLPATDDETPWCSPYVHYCFGEIGIKGTGSAAAKSWLRWVGGRQVKTPKYGDVVVFHRGQHPWQGHVGFFVGKDSKGNFLILGGNQGNKVKVSAYPAQKVAGIIRPKE